MIRNGKKIDSRGSAIRLRETYNFVKFNNKLIQWVLGHILIKKNASIRGKTIRRRFSYLLIKSNEASLFTV